MNVKYCLKQRKNFIGRAFWSRHLTALLLALFVVLPRTKSDSVDPGQTYTRLPSASADETDGDDSEDNSGDLFMIEGLETAEEHLILRDLETRRLYRYSYSLLTKWRDKFGGRALVTDFEPGLVVTIGDLDAERRLSVVTISDKAFVMDGVSNYSVDAEKGNFTIGNTLYRLPDTATVFSGGLVSDLAAITANDILRVVGIDHDIISLSVTTGHGYLFVTNTATFADSLMQIGDRIFTMVTPQDMTIEVPEGTYAVTVANKGYGGTKEVTVARGETVGVNLDELKGEGPKTCLVTFKTEVENARIFLDGKEVEKDAGLSVTYGRHRLKVTAEGYDDWSKILYVNSPTAEISLDLSDEKQSASTTSNGTTNGTNDAATSSSSASANTSTTSGSASEQARNIISNATNGTNSTNSSGTSNSTTTNASDRDGDGDYDQDDAQLDYLSTISKMISSLSDSND